VDKNFSKLCREKGGGIVVGGENYGQGSSREHAAIGPRYLGVRIKIAKSFARIHRSNLINFGIVPMTFKDTGDYEQINKGDRLSFPELKKAIEEGKDEINALSGKKEITLRLNLTERERKCILEGGLLNLVKKEKALLGEKAK
jgi:aconitate hydratase